MEVIKIKKSLYYQLSDEADTNDGYADYYAGEEYDEDGIYLGDPPLYNAILYLLGKDKKGVITEAICIGDSMGENGCEFMPGIEAEELTKAYLELAKKKLIPCAFGHVAPKGCRAVKQFAKWPWVYGHDIFVHKNTPFIRFDSLVRAFVNRVGKKITELKVKAV
jgi:hypothetical protein